MIRDVAPRRRIAAAVGAVAFAFLAAPLLLLNAIRRRRGPVSKILVLEPWGIGDLVLATGALRSCRAAFPTARITVLAKSYAESIVVSPKMADDVAPYDFPWTAFTDKYRISRYRLAEIARLVWRLRRARYDLVLNARADVRNNLLGALVGGDRFVSAACGVGDLLATEVVNLDRDAHRAEDWNRVAQQAIGASPTQPRPRLTVDAAVCNRVRAELGLAEGIGPIIGIHPGARIGVRRWEISRFAAVADRLVQKFGGRLVVFAEPDGYGEAIPARTPFVAVRRGLTETIAAIGLCDVLVCNDSGPMHIASALDVPVAAVFGPTSVEWFGPLGATSEVVRIDEMPCRPCFDVCIFAEPRCMTAIDEEAVFKAASTLLSGAVGARETLPPHHDHELSSFAVE